MPDAKKKELVELLARREIPLIEDDIYGDLCFGAARPKRQKPRQTGARALVLFVLEDPGSRVSSRLDCSGPIQTPSREAEVYHSMATATAPQMAIADFLQSGYDRYRERFAAS